MFRWLLSRACLALLLLSLAASLIIPDIPIEQTPRALSPRNDTTPATEGDDGAPPLLRNATLSDVDVARAIVKAAIAEAAKHNKARLENPSRNQYTLYEPQHPARLRSTDTSPPLLEITDEMRKAAALVAEADAWEALGNGTQKRHVKRAGSFWIGSVGHRGKWPFGNNDADFEVFRDVTQYGAKGDGVTDDTAAIRKAVEAGKMCGPGCYSSTTKGAIIYFPPGTYLVSGTIETYYGTQFIGDAIDRPTIKAAASFIGLGVISTDKYVENGGVGADGNAKEWFINTANFYRQIRNFIIDITSTDQGAYVAALHYQVAQATSLQFVEFKVSTNSGTTQQAIYAENGSGGFMSDLVFNGGAFGIYGGSQQFTAQRLTFNNVRTAVQLIWDWGWTWKTIQINNCGTGFRLIGENGVSNTGSVMIVDSVFKNTPTAILTYPATTETGKGSTGVTLDNVIMDNVSDGLVDTTGKVYLKGSDAKAIDTWVMGRIYTNQEQSEALSNFFTTTRIQGLTGPNPLGLPKAPYFERAKPQYTEGGSFVHMLQFTTGNGVSDDTGFFQWVLDNYCGTSIIYIDAGSYILTDTINIPTYCRIVGENWAQLVATGSKFNDEKNPRPLLKVGEPESRGTVELQDLIFTSKGPTAGLIFVEWNIRADTPGSAGMWDCHSRSGGAIGTDLNSADCPKSGASAEKCKAGSMLMHVTKHASGYFENVWFWVSDHDIDDVDWNDDGNSMPMNAIYVARGVLIESTTASWYYGTASEHSVMYQYALVGAENIYMAMIQTEEPYYQPSPSPPTPFENALAFNGDPTYNQAGDESDAGWALMIRESADVTIHGAGLYSWFQTFEQTCLATKDCQKSMVKLDNNGNNVRIHNLVTIGGVNMIVSDGKSISAAENLAVDFHPYWSQIAVFDPIQNNIDDCNADPTVDPEMPYVILEDMGSNSGLMWFAIFNGSPYTMKKGHTNAYQIYGLEGDWDDEFVDIPPGESLQVYTSFAYDGGVDIDHWDDQAEIYYSLEGTDKSFHIHAWVDTNASPMWKIDIVLDELATKDARRGDTISLSTPKDGNFGAAVQWGLVGSDLYGYWSRPSVTWMKDNLELMGDRKMKYICMPGSHDAGMSELDGKTAFATSDNTQTQLLTIYNQLLRGARWFDMRPCLGNGGKHMLCHYGGAQSNGQPTAVQLGANGQSVQEAIDDINNFMADHPGELVILDISNEAGFDTDNPAPGTLIQPRLTEEQWIPILDSFSNGIKKPCPSFSTALYDVTLSDLIGNGAGCVVSSIRSIPASPRSNQVTSSSAFDQYNRYSETDDVRTMVLDQVSKLQTNRVLLAEDDKRTKNGFFVFSWTMTWNVSPWSIQNMAAMAYSHLFTYGFQHFTPFSYPNVLYVDYYGSPHFLSLDLSQEERLAQTNGDLVMLALAVNLQLAGANCHTGGKSLLD